MEPRARGEEVATEVRWLAVAMVALISSSSDADCGTVRQPVVVELFHRPDCTSCLSALVNLDALADAPGVIALSFDVTDTEAGDGKPIFGARQRDRARAPRRSPIATPQTIINGRLAADGRSRKELDRAIATQASIGPSITFGGGDAIVAAGRVADPATVWLVTYKRRARSKAGEVSGETPPRRNVVGGLEALGQWTGSPARFRMRQYRWNDPNRGHAILVQQGVGGPIIAAKQF